MIEKFLKTVSKETGIPIEQLQEKTPEELAEDLLKLSSVLSIDSLERIIDGIYSLTEYLNQLEIVNG